MLQIVNHCGLFDWNKDGTVYPFFELVRWTQLLLNNSLASHSNSNTNDGCEWTRTIQIVGYLSNSTNTHVVELISTCLKLAYLTLVRKLERKLWISIFRQSTALFFEIMTNLCVFLNWLTIWMRWQHVKHVTWKESWIRCGNFTKKIRSHDVYQIHSNTTPN